MLATLGSAPVRGDNLAIEWKWDGQRAIIIVTGTDVAASCRETGPTSRGPSLS
jgi:ATP-dependent DNA ligase